MAFFGMRNHHKFGMGAFVILLTSVSWVSSSRAQCFSDEELHNVLRGVFVYGIGQTLGACTRMYPLLRQSASDTMASFGRAYSSQMRELDRRTESAFERNYPGRGRQARDENMTQANRPALLQLEAFSEIQCKQSIYGTQIMARINDWEKVMMPARMFFQSERARSPRCN